jgi:hypothetical protein
MRHHPDCDFWCDHYPSECTCGAERPKAAWFDAHAARCDAVRSELDRDRAGIPVQASAPLPSPPE